jgi:hypothetical protein
MDQIDALIVNTPPRNLEVIAVIQGVGGGFHVAGEFIGPMVAGRGKVVGDGVGDAVGPEGYRSSGRALPPSVGADKGLIGAKMISAGAKMISPGAKVILAGAKITPAGANKSSVGAKMILTGANLIPLGAKMIPLGANGSHFGAD